MDPRHSINHIPEASIAQIEVHDDIPTTATSVPYSMVAFVWWEEEATAKTVARLASLSQFFGKRW